MQRRAGSRVSIRSNKSRAEVGKLCREGFIIETHQSLMKAAVGTERGYTQGKLLTQPPPVLFLGFHGVEEGKFDDVGPGCRTGTPTQTAEDEQRFQGRSRRMTRCIQGQGRLPDEFQLKKLLVRLEDGLLGEELSQNAPEA